MRKIIYLFILLSAIWALIAYAQQPDLIFSHKFHAEEVEAGCVDCHTGVMESSSPEDNLLPSMETCYNCHDEDDTECTLCHIDPDAAGEVERITGLKANFAHSKHVKSEEDCQTCHTNILEKDSPMAESLIPGQKDCGTCHDNYDYREEKLKCQTCHDANFEFKPADHSVLWNKSHGLNWEVDETSCNHCHDNNYCTTCHEGDNLDRLAHPLNYRNNHGIQARGNKDNCLTCHEEFAFCVECHKVEMVMPRSHSFAGWSNTTTGGAHARAALYDFDSCSSCHNDAYSDNVCLPCHSD